MEFNGNTYIFGYFQTEKYFKHLRKELLEDFTLKTPLNEENVKMLTKIKSTNSVSIHVRRTDYLLQHKKIAYDLSDSDYFPKAIAYIGERVKNPHFFIFSDDIAWCKKNLNIKYEHTFVELNDESNGVFDLELMKNCKHNIIANSTFSWWGGWLNENPDKIVVAPALWFRKGDNQTVPDDWVRIKFDTTSA